MPKYIDIHAHTNFKIFDTDRDVVLSRALSDDTWVINIGTQFDTSKKAVEMTNEYEGVYATIGLHPIHTGASYHDEAELGPLGKEFTSRGEIFDKEKYKELAKLGKVVGIGECGLDYYHMDPARSHDGSGAEGEESIEKQKTAFISQIELANELGLPLMLHVRNHSPLSPQTFSSSQGSKNAYFDVYELIKKYSKNMEVGLPKITGVSHFFAGSVEDMKRFIEIGIYISFAGPITYKPRPEICDYESVIKATPLEMILADTDSPYVAPVPHRGTRNEPSYVKDIVAKIAQIKGLDEEKVANQIVLNAKRLFDLS